MDWALIIGSSGFAGVAYLIFKIGRFTQHIDSSFSEVKKESKELRMDIERKHEELKDNLNKKNEELKDNFNKKNEELKENFNKKYQELKYEIREIKTDVSDIKDRLTFMEAFLFFSGMGPEPASTHSERMKKAWEKRKMKQIEAKEK